MAKEKTVFVCSQCGYESGRWLGKCLGCGEWNTFEEVTIVPEVAAKRTASPRGQAVPVQRMNDIDLSDAMHDPIGMAELDHVLGGGLIDGSVVLVGGEPGVGKSTLLLQAAQLCAQKGRAALYVSGEESARQVRLRAKRLGAEAQALYMLAQTDIDEVVAAMAQFDRPLVILDSIQTMHKQGVNSSMGSVSQVRECAASALRAAKESGATVVLVGHVTKEGSLAGPRVLEHMVDTVLYFEGEKQSSFRVLRAVKNRFGSTNEIGVFEMTQFGMREVPNPSLIMLSHHTKKVAGSAITCLMEGTRPVLCEVQALCAASPYGQPRRMATGVDYNRMLLMIAVLERSGGIPLFQQDVYTNAVGGLRLSEPSSDLALLAAMASAATGRPVFDDMAIIGEVGLTGEVRPVSMMERRMAECAKMGLGRLIVPQAAYKTLRAPNGMTLIGVESVKDMLKCALSTKENGTPAI